MSTVTKSPARDEPATALAALASRRLRPGRQRTVITVDAMAFREVRPVIARSDEIVATRGESAWRPAGLLAGDRLIG